MKKISLTALILVGIYTLLRNNVFLLPDQFMWSTNPDLFYKVFLPLLMVTSSAFSLFKDDKKNIFYLAFITALIDVINRLALGVNHLYFSIMVEPPPTPPEVPEGYIAIVPHYWPSHIMGVVEIAVIIYLFLLIKYELKTNINS